MTSSTAPERAESKAQHTGSPNFRAVIGMTFLIMVGFGLVVPSLPSFIESLGHQEAGVGVVVLAFAATRLFGDLFAGTLIDRLGERRVTSIGAAIVGISSIAAGAARTFWQLVVFRGLGGVGSAFFLGGLMAYLIRTTPADQRGRAMSYFQASFGLGFLIGPVFGGIMLTFAAPNVPLYVYGAVCLACVPLCLRALGTKLAGTGGGAPVARGARAEAPPLGQTPLPIDEASPAPRIPAWRHLRPLLSDSAYRAALCVSALTFMLGQVQFTLLAKFWTGLLHQSKGTLGVPYFASAILGFAVVRHAGSITDRRGRKSALVPALGLTAIGTAALGFTRSPVVFLALLAITGLFGGYLRPGPSAIVGDVASPEARGVAVSGYRIAGDIGALLGPLTGWIAQHYSYQAAFMAVGAVAALVFVVVALARESAPARQNAPAPARAI